MTTVHLMTLDNVQYEFEKLLDEAIWLCQIVNTFNHLFDSGPDTQELLRKSASLFFDDLNRLMHEYVILLVCRLTGPACTAGKDNLTTQRITTLLREKGNITTEIEELDANLSNYGKLLKPARDKIVAHSDLQVYTELTALGGHEKQIMTEFLDNVQRYFDAVGNVIGVGSLDFRHTPGKGDVIDLLRQLRKANDSVISSRLGRRESE